MNRTYNFFIDEQILFVQKEKVQMSIDDVICAQSRNVLTRFPQ